MSPRPASDSGGFSALLAAMASQPLHEIGPASVGADPAALGFALGLAAGWVGSAGLIWAGEEGVFAEDGAPYPPGLAAFGLDPARVLVVRAAKRDEALWAAEQGLAAPGAVVLCALTGGGKALELKATRRLLLFAEKNGSRCILLRRAAEPSAAWTRWRVSPAPSVAEARELGPPAYAVELTRNRAGSAGARFLWIGTPMDAPSWLAIYLPRLNTDRLIRAGRAPKDRPFALYAKEANAFLLTGVNASASALGLRLAMSLADARAIRPDLAAMEAQPDEDARALDLIAAWCERFTPVVVLDAPEGLFLDISGCAHLFGGETALRDQILTRLYAQGYSARAAIAPTPGAAWAMARYSRESACATDIVQSLASLPVEALRLDEAAASLLTRLGLRTIGQLIRAPRSSFTARAGERAMLRLDQALGRAREALTPRRPPPPVFALRRFLEPLFSVETILVATEALCGDVLAKLDVRGAGARRLALHLFGVDGRDHVIEIGVSRPERDAKALMRLLREKLTRAAEGLDAEFGIEAARLDVVALERMETAPQTLTKEETRTASAEQIAAMVDMLSARLGAARVLRPKLTEVHLPERAGGWKSALNERSSSGKERARAAADNVARRPLTLFSRAQPIEALATVPDGPPIRFRWRRVLREVVRAEGPERISGDWLGGAPTRDYYRVEDKDGRRYWLYREGLYGEDADPRWYVHGLFA
ncbi:MAG: hypothetical protein R3C16_05605 [Hyphomonadaceae bacterium]